MAYLNLSEKPSDAPASCLIGVGRVADAEDLWGDASPRGDGERPLIESLAPNGADPSALAIGSSSASGERVSAVRQRGTSGSRRTFEIVV
jgi:hypothetical protein